ncbi:MAG: YceI family protein [Gemmatimonadales bacterium]|nr:YceI family protein [Gemmatimonadales bacterium]
MLKQLRRLSLAAFVVLAPSPAPAELAAQAAPQWKVDLAHSEMSFKIRHLMSKVSGTFNDWSGTITGDPKDWSKGTVEIVIQAASIDTRNERRDGHLKSNEFFDVAKFPTLAFKSTKVTVSGTRLTVAGDLTMHGVTKPVVLEGEYTGTTGAGDKQKVGFSFTTKLNRLDYGVTWNRAVEGGGVTLGDEVTIEINVEAVRAAGAA